MSALSWLENHGEYECCFNGHWGFIEPDPPYRSDESPCRYRRYRAFDARFPRTEFGKGFVGSFSTVDQQCIAALKAVEGSK